MTRVSEGKNSDKTAKDEQPAGADKPGKETTKPADPKDDVVTTEHQLKVGRRTLHYTATAGRVVLRDEVYEDGVFKGNRAKAEMSVVSYVVDDTDKTPRPVTFAFNGGPGSSSVWLHLGLLGPRRVVMGDAGELAPPPYALADNAESLLTVSDLVLIDPVSTGYSRVIEHSKPEPFHGYQGDLESVGELIRLWTSRHKRWMSAKFLIGESYGTLRAAALAEHLQTRHGLYLNGIMLVSSVLDLSSIDFENQRNDRAHALYLPTYTAIAHYHGKHGRASLRSVLAEAEEYAAREYPWVLSQGSRLSARERSRAVSTIARLSGLSEDYIDRADLRIEHVRYFTELLRDRRQAVGRLDARFVGPAASGIAEMMDADPSHDAISGPYAAALNHYVRADLGYENDLPYEQISRRVQPWSFKDFEGRPVDVTPMLERAMRQNPDLKVQVAYGWYDGATPYFAAQDVFAHLRIPDSLRANIEHKYYPSGHMTYVHEPSRVQQSRDIADFVERAAHR